MAITYRTGLTDVQKQGIENLVSSGRTFNETDAKNYAYATGAVDYNQFLGKTGSQITVPSTVSASAITSGNTFQTTPQTPVANPSDFVNRINAGIGAADKIYQEGITKAQTQLEPFQKEQTNLVERIKSLMGTRTNTTDYYNQQLQTAGVPETQKALNDLNIQIANRTADFNNAIAKIPGQGIGLTTGAVQGLTDRERRISAVELGNLGILKLAYQENINAATKTAKDLVDFKYQDEKAAIDDQLALLQLNYDQMSTAEKRVAEQQAVLLQDRQARIDEAKAESTAIANSAIEAARLGAPSNVAQQMQQATSLQEALSIGADYLQEAPDTQVVDMGNSKVLINSKTGEVIKNLGTTSTGGGIGSGTIITTPTGQNVDLNAAIDFAVTNLTKDGRSNAYATFNKFLKDGNTEAAAQYIDKLLLDKLPAGQKEEIGTMGTVSQLADQVLKFNQDGALEGVGGFGKGSFGQLTDKLFGTSTEEARTVRVLVGNIKGTIAKLRGGTSFTDTEKKLLETYTPTINENSAVVVNKINNLKDYILKKQNDTLYSGLPVFTGSQTQTGGTVDSAKSKYGITY